MPISYEAAAFGVALLGLVVGLEYGRRQARLGTLSFQASVLGEALVVVLMGLGIGAGSGGELVFDGLAVLVVIAVTWLCLAYMHPLRRIERVAALFPLI